MPEKIIDTHVHTWDFQKATYDWLKNDTSILNRNYLVEEYNEARQAEGITGAVLVQAANNFEDTELMLHAAAKHDWIKGVVGWLPLIHPKQLEAGLTERLNSNPLLKGVRHLVHDEPDPRWLLQPAVIESLQILAIKNLTYDLVGVLPQHIETAIEVAEKVPQLKLVFDHLNQPPISSRERYGEWGALMQHASQHPNFYVKISGLGTTCNKGKEWNAADISPYLEFAFETFGIQRCFCGGDWPVSLLAASFKHTWDVYKEALKNLLNEVEREQVFYNNATSFYQL